MIIESHSETILSYSSLSIYPLCTLFWPYIDKEALLHPQKTQCFDQLSYSHFSSSTPLMKWPYWLFVYNFPPSGYHWHPCSKQSCHILFFQTPFLFCILAPHWPNTHSHSTNQHNILTSPLFPFLPLLLLWTKIFVNTEQCIINLIFKNKIWLIAFDIVIIIFCNVN